MTPSTAPADLSVLIDAFGARGVLTDADRRRPYEVPERGAPGHAQAVLVPDTEADVQRALQIANANGLHFVLSGGRTGLVESQRPQGEIVLSLE